MTVVTRFAPSPTGRLHIGNIRTALLNALLARREGGRFLLRIDDTDRERSTDAFDAAIRADLDWLGLTPDHAVRQSERFELYQSAFDRLVAAGRVYACYETPEELELRRKVLLGRGRPPIYERKPPDAPVPEGRSPHWRFRLDHGAPISWQDAIRGAQRFDPRRIGDPVVRRADGSWLYLLPSVIDDIDLGVTHIVRGEDHVSNSAVQLQMFAALGAAPPALAHAALLTEAGGKLSKRLGSLGVDAVRAAGIEPLALLAVLARIGTSHAVEPVAELAELAADFDLGDFGRAPAQFDLAEVEAVNRRMLHHLDHADARDRLPQWVGPREWALLRGNIDHLDELEQWRPVLDGTIDPPAVAAEDRPFLEMAVRILAELDFDDGPWSDLTSRLKADSGRKGRALFMPLRLALTGRESGPEMAPLLERIGREGALARLIAASRE